MLSNIHHYIDNISLLLCTGSIITVIADYNIVLTTAALTTTIAYNCYKWYKEIKRKK
jgi:hypothetical protein